MAMTDMQKKMYSARGKNVKIVCVDGEKIEGYCIDYIQPIDNEPEVAEIAIKKGERGLIGITEPEIKEIEYLN